MADSFEDEMENTMTIDEYIQGIEADELEADLVLGGDEGKECTYSNGYMKRQAIFSCLTCVPAGNAGVCTACSLSCHDGHEVVELWTKRKLRCDCGNSKFGAFVCKLCPDKDPENTDNSYNHNFKGSYCTCGRPYPDPQAEEQVEMIQCIICEDWFHETHLGLDSSEEIPNNEEGEPLYEELICQDCALTCSFLKLYPASIWATLKQKNVPEKSSNEENALEHGSSACTYPEKIEIGIPVSESLMKCTSTFSESKAVCNGNNSLDGTDTLKNSGLEKAKSCCHDIASSSKCILGVDINATLVSEEKKPMFLSRKWRDLLCSCLTCREFYIKAGIDYLIDKEDSLEEYEKMAKQKREEKLQQQEGAELNFLNGLDHVQKIEILGGIADMKDEFRSFLMSSSSSNVGSTRRWLQYLPLVCNTCGRKTVIRVSETDNNPGRLLYACLTPSCGWIGWAVPVEQEEEHVHPPPAWTPPPPRFVEQYRRVAAWTPLPSLIMMLVWSNLALVAVHLESFDSSKSITPTDIQGVFENLAKKKKQRLH